MSELQRTPLYEKHLQLGGRMVDFAGFSMPVQFSSIKAEHRAVRERAGLFDVSHMGQIRLEGPEAIESAERLLTCRIASLKAGQVRYGLMCNAEGGCVDDVTVYREAEDRLFLCVNAANIVGDLHWIQTHTNSGARVLDRSPETGLLALQGPESGKILDTLVSPTEAGPPTSLGRFRFARYAFDATELLISRTGYTGADGFEIYLPASACLDFHHAAMVAGEPHGLVPAGLGARDTLRLEAALPLYGHELDASTSPLEAGLERFVKREEGHFIGAEAIEARARGGLYRRLIGFELEERGVARADHAIESEGRELGRVTSGAPSPSLGKSVGLGYVPPEFSALGTPIQIVIRERRVGARVVETPFIR